MRRRYREITSTALSYLHISPFYALRERLKQGYGWKDLKADLMSGSVVGMVAIPLGMALAIASGVPPQYGLYTVIIAGFLVAFLGGSRFQVTGPTAAFVVILVPIVHRFGFSGLLLSGLMAGILLVLMGLAGMGRMIQYIPHPVTTGFTTGIAVVIATIQLKDFFGLQVSGSADSYVERVLSLYHHRTTGSTVELAVGAATLALLLLWPKINRRIPAPLVALSVVATSVAALKHFFPELSIATIGTRFGGIPSAPPQFVLPWKMAGVGGESFLFTLDTVRAIAPSALAVAMLAAIESLLSAVVADGMAKTRHNPDSELVALGVANIVCPFFGGIAATGAIARTATNIRFGARSPFSAMFHAVFALGVVLVLGRWVSYLPMASLAALLMLVAYNMSEVKHFAHILRVAPRSDVIVLLLCFSLTVLFDMVVGVSVGMVLAAFLLMRRMADLTHGQPIEPAKALGGAKNDVPKSVLIYEIAGPMFFGATQRAVGAISATTDDIRTVIFRMDRVPAMDVTGLVALETAVHRLTSHHKLVIFTGVQPEPAGLIRRAGLLDGASNVVMHRTLEEGIAEASARIRQATA